MAKQKLSADEWAEYLALYKELSERLAREPWFAEGWETRFDYIDKENPRGVSLQLVRPNWFDGAIHLETWLNNAVLERETTPLVLHVETSMSKHGLSRNDFSRLFLERSGDRIQSWPGYAIKPTYAMEPFNVAVPFTKAGEPRFREGEALRPLGGGGRAPGLVSALATEFARVQQLGPVIDQTIEDTKR